MLDLNGVVSVDIITEVNEYTRMRLKNKDKFETPEALALYEQKYLEREKIKELCEKHYGMELEEPTPTYMPDYIVRMFEGSEIVPVQFSPMHSEIVCVKLNELNSKCPIVTQHKVKVVPTTLYYYIERYSEAFGAYPELQRVPEKQLLDDIIKEAISLDAADITISTRGKYCSVYYNVRKRTVHSNRILSENDMAGVIKYLCIKSPMDEGSSAPKYVGKDLNESYRGRVVINRKFKGYVITIRLLPKAAFDREITDLNLSQSTIEFLLSEMMNREPGLRVISGGTMSGKNTTILTLLKRIVALDQFKVVSIEMPVEQELYGIEQIQCDTEDEYQESIRSLIRQNPDYVYVTEMGDATGRDVVQMTNTGKCVFSTVHANSAIDTIDRLVDITGYSADRVIQTVHSICYQELVRDDVTDTVRPKNKYIRLDLERKLKLYGKSHGEMILLLKEWEEGDVW
jgi:Tfp pilus assembly pilus retraction ATPase PilT